MGSESDFLEGRINTGHVIRPTDDLITDPYGSNPRFKVDPGETGFFARRMWRVSHEFSGAGVVGATPVVFKVSIPVNFIIHAQSLQVDIGGIAMRAYRGNQGTEGGTFGTAVPILSNNFMTEEPAYTFQASILTGGTFTVTPGQVAVETIRVRTSGATAQQTSVGGQTFDHRGLFSADHFYLVFSKLSGVAGDSEGVYSLLVEERPNGSALP